MGAIYYNIHKLNSIDKCRLHCGECSGLDGVVYNIGSLHQWEVMNPLGVLMMPDNLQWLLHFNFMLVNGIWSVNRNRLFYGDGYFYCVGFGYERVMSVLHNLGSGYWNRNSDIVL